MIKYRYVRDFGHPVACIAFDTESMEYGVSYCSTKEKGFCKRIGRKIAENKIRAQPCNKGHNPPKRSNLSSWYFSQELDRWCFSYDISLSFIIQNKVEYLRNVYSAKRKECNK